MDSFICFRGSRKDTSCLFFWERMLFTMGLCGDPIGQPFWKMLKAPGSHSPWTMGGTATYHGSCQDCRLIVNILGYSRFLVHANGNQLIRNKDWSLQRTIDITHFFGVPFEQRNLFFHFRLQLWDSSSKTPPGDMEPEKWGLKDP